MTTTFLCPSNSLSVFSQAYFFEIDISPGHSTWCFFKLIYLKSTVTLVKTEEDRFGSVFLYLVSDPLIQTPKHLRKLILQV